ncbi:MAG: UPF0262 family protein [Deltaproteobacteria bacterium]|nr:UPF0262 family protein [Deltaproteobacteria bacterium]MCB9788432.1 UPF0262 family protein [Deltaproteobacteria bacterium]
MKFRLMPEVWEDAAPEREREWRQTLGELNLDHGSLVRPGDAGAEEPVVTLGRHPEGGLLIVVALAGGEESTVHLNHRRMRGAFRDYKQVIEQIARATSGAFGPRDLETLDYAKKVVHDEAAELIQEALSERVHLPHKLARRIFTLAFLITHDLPQEIVSHFRHPR